VAGMSNAAGEGGETFVPDETAGAGGTAGQGPTTDERAGLLAYALYDERDRLWVYLARPPAFDQSMRLLEPTSAESSVARWGWSPDGNYVFAVVAASSFEPPLPWLVPVGADGPGGPRPIAGLTQADIVVSWQFAPDGRHLALFTGSQVLALVDVANSGPALVVDHGVAHSGRWSPDGRRLAYVASVPGGVAELRAVEVGSEASPAVLSTLALASLDTGEWSPAGSRLAFHDADGLSVLGFDGTLPASPFRVDSADMPARESPRALWLSESRLLYQGWLEGGLRPALFRVDLEGDQAGLPRVVNPTLGGVSSLSDAPDAVAVSPARDHVAFKVIQGDTSRVELYVADVSGKAPGEPKRVELAYGEGAGEVRAFDWSPEGESLLVIADTEVEGRGELYRVDVSALHAPVELARGGGGTGLLRSGKPWVAWSPDASSVVFIRAGASNGREQIGWSSALGPGSRLLSATYPALSLVPAGFSRDGSWFAYTANTGNGFHFAISIEGTEEPTRLALRDELRFANSLAWQPAGSKSED
jgi:Tol biopolymer transport system component